MTEISAQKVRLTWEDVEMSARALAQQLQGEHFDLILGISRGGLIPTALLARLLVHYNVVVISVRFYDDNDERLEHPLILEAPAEPVLHGKRVLIVDDVWDTGETIALVTKFVTRAGGIPIVATLHYKPHNSTVEGAPNYFVHETAAWIVYPWEALTS